MIIEYPADLHIHTCLSPCANDEMIPVNILNMAKLMGTKILGICDHNSSKNTRAVMELAPDYGIFIIPGMEVESIEEVHLLCYFRDLKTALKLQEYVGNFLQPIKNDPRYFGNQKIVDSYGNMLEIEEKMLLASTLLTVEEISKKVSDLGGLLVPAHVDKRYHSIISQLGFIPEGLCVDALEFSRATTLGAFRGTFKDISNYTLITSSDAHSLKEMVYQKMYLCMKALTFEEVIMAFKGLEGRKVIIKDLP